MIRRNYLGLDVGPGQLRAVVLRRHGKGSSLTGGRVLSLVEGTMVPSIREPNIRDTRRFVQGVQEVLGPLAGREERIALSLPDFVGRVLLTKVETAFKSKSEGLEILRWQLKKSLPVDPKAIQLDYQVLEKSDAGGYRLAVTLMVRSVLEQYEDVLSEAGFNAAVVDYHSLNLLNFYRPRLDRGEDFVMVGIEGDFLSFQFFQGQILAYHRVREVETTPARVFQEVKRSLVACQEAHPAFRRAAVFLHCDREETEPLLEALRAAFGRDVLLLNPHLERLAPVPLELSERQARGLVAAVGAAERMM